LIQKRKRHNSGTGATGSIPQPPEPAGKQYDCNNSSTDKYIKFSKPKIEKSCYCYACIDSGFEYRNNPVLIEDNNPQIFQLFGKDLTK
jgi:hypothetical protein